jgi:hypothetical protein
MARALVIEEESGTSRGRVHPHNGYYAGNFSAPASVGAAPFTAVRHTDVVPGSAAASMPPSGHYHRSTIACSPAR